MKIRNKFFRFITIIFMYLSVLLAFLFVFYLIYGNHNTIFYQKFQNFWIDFSLVLIFLGNLFLWPYLILKSRRKIIDFFKTRYTWKVVGVFLVLYILSIFSWRILFIKEKFIVDELRFYSFFLIFPLFLGLIAARFKPRLTKNVLYALLLFSFLFEVFIIIFNYLFIYFFFEGYDEIIFYKEDISVYIFSFWSFFFFVWAIASIFLWLRNKFNIHKPKIFAIIKSPLNEFEYIKHYLTTLFVNLVILILYPFFISYTIETFDSAFHFSKLDFSIWNTILCSIPLVINLFFLVFLGYITIKSPFSSLQIFVNKPIINRIISLSLLFLMWILLVTSILQIVNFSFSYEFTFAPYIEENPYDWDLLLITFMLFLNHDQGDIIAIGQIAKVIFIFIFILRVAFLGLIFELIWVSFRQIIRDDL